MTAEDFLQMRGGEILKNVEKAKNKETPLVK